MEEDAVLIEPRRVPGDPEFDHPVILALYEPYLDLLCSELRIEKSALGRLRFPAMTFATAMLESRPVSVVGAPLGAPQAAILLERIVAMGARDIVAFGCCGSLQPHLRTGDLVLPIEALSEEGTSVHYPLTPGKPARADERISRLLRDKCGENALPAAAGTVWTTDALFRETRSKTKRYAGMGLLAVDMEMSALLTVAAYRRVRLSALLVVLDELFTLHWRAGFQNPLFWTASRQAARLVLEACIAL